MMVTMATQIPSLLAPLRSEIVSHFAKVVVIADDDRKESKDLVVCVFLGNCCLSEDLFSKILGVFVYSLHHRLVWQHWFYSLIKVFHTMRMKIQLQTWKKCYSKTWES